jgi:multiple sugar transport system ATP-binding protein
METRAQIVNLQRQLGITTIYVTHNQVEAMTMGHRIAVINQDKFSRWPLPWISTEPPPTGLWRSLLVPRQ